MKFKDNFFILLIMFFLFGFLVTIQIRSTVSVQQQSRETLDTGRLKNQLDEKIKTGAYYKSQITELENKKEAFLKASPENNTNLSLKMELEYLKMVSGLTDVSGDGIVLTLNDAEVAPEDEDVSGYIIHDEDILNIINLLKLSGAQAISINDERIIATSEQLCAGPTIKINDNRYAVPYQIKAIGDASKLYNEMSESEIVKDLIEWKKRVTIETKKNIVIPKFKNDINGLVSRLEVTEDEGNENK